MLDIVLDAFKSTVNNLMKLHFLPLYLQKKAELQSLKIFYIT